MASGSDDLLDHLQKQGQGLSSLVFAFEWTINIHGHASLDPIK